MGMQQRHLKVLIDTQVCLCYEQDKLVKELNVSTSRKGSGQRQGSYQTPLGRHVIRAKIGAEQPQGSVFVGRRPTGEIWTSALHQQYPERDWILTRILWLSGQELGHNRLGKVDSMRRYIYIHGTPEIYPVGTPASHGCIRMTNSDVTWIFDWIDVGCEVAIQSSLEIYS